MAESQAQVKQRSTRVLPGSLKPTVRVKPQLLKYPGTTLYSKNQTETENFCKNVLELKNLQEIGFDMEWKVSYVPNQAQPKTALVQLCYETDTNQYNCLCVHVFYTGITPSLQKILESSEIKKVGVNILNDASKFNRDFGVQINGIVELMNEARSRILDDGATIAYTGRTNMQTLVEKVLGMLIEKEDSIRKCNWEAQNLTQTQLLYAVLDAYASLLLYKKIVQFKKPEPQNKSDSNNQSSSTQQQSQENIDPNSAVQNSADQNNDQTNTEKNVSSDKTANLQDVEMLSNEEFSEWEKTTDNFINVTPTKLQVYDMFMRQGYSFQKIAEIKKVKLGTAQEYFHDAMKSGYQYQWSKLNISEDFSDQLLSRIKAVCPELVEIIVEVTQQIQSETGVNDGNLAEIKGQIEKLFGDVDCRNLSQFLREQNSCTLTNLKGETEMEFSDIKFQLMHWGRILQWVRLKE